MQAHRVYLVWLYEKEVVSNPPRVFHWTGYSDRIEIQYLNHVGTLILQHKQISTHQNWDVQYIHICTCKQSLHVVFLYLSRSLSLSFLSRCPRWCSLYVLVSMGKTAAWNRFIRSRYFIAFEKCLREKTTKSNSTFYIDLHLVSYKHQTQFREYEKKSFPFFFGCQNIDAM